MMVNTRWGRRLWWSTKFKLEKETQGMMRKKRTKRRYTFFKSGCFLPFVFISPLCASVDSLAALNPCYFSLQHSSLPDNFVHLSTTVTILLKGRAFCFLLSHAYNSAWLVATLPKYPILAGLLFTGPGHVLIRLHQDALTLNGMHLKT